MRFRGESNVYVYRVFFSSYLYTFMRACGKGFICGLLYMCVCEGEAGNKKNMFIRIFTCFIFAHCLHA